MNIALGLANSTLKKFLKKGLLIRPIGNTIYLMPPYCIDNKTLENVYSILDAELKNI